MSNDDKTIITFRRDGSPGNNSYPSGAGGGFQRPMPGGRGPSASQASAPSSGSSPTVGGEPIQPVVGIPPTTTSIPPQPIAQSQSVTSTPPIAAANFQSTVFINPLLYCANDLIDRMASIRGSTVTGENETVRDPGIFREETVRQIRDFEWRCGQQGVDEESILYSRYILCTVIDEFATKTTWGGQGVWSSQSLLSQFHDETGGGEKFFQILEHLQTQPATYLPVLELMYISMSLGFEGKYSLENRGNVEIENLRDNLFHLMRLQRGEPERDLSPHWQGVSEKRYALMKHVPVWVFSALAGVVLLVLFSGFSYQLTTTKDGLLVALQEPIAAYLPITSEVSEEQSPDNLAEHRSSDPSIVAEINEADSNTRNQEPK